MGHSVEAPPPEIALSEDSHDFGPVPIEQIARWSLYIANDGVRALEISEISVLGQIFSCDFTEPVVIGADDPPYRVIVSFIPAFVREYGFTMTIRSNDPDNGEISVLLSGEGIKEGDPMIALVEDEHFFGNVVIDESASWRMVILNEGDADLLVTAVESNSEAFTTDFEGEALLRPDDHFNVLVTFTPDDDAYFNGFIIITSNDPVVEVDSVALVGRGGAADERHFRYQETIVDGSHTLHVMEATLEGDALVEGDEVGVFTESGLCAGGGFINEDGEAGLTAWVDDESTYIIVIVEEDTICYPVINGFVEGELFAFKVWDVDAEVEAPAVAEFLEESPEVFTPNGISHLNLAAEFGLPEPNIELSATEHDFGQADWDDDQRKEWGLSIANHGFGLLVVEEIASDQWEFGIDFEGPVELTFMQELEVTVTFRPTAAEEFAGRLAIGSNDPLDPMLYVDLYGVGVDVVEEPDIELSADEYYFGVLPVEDAAGEYVLSIVTLGTTLTIEGIEHLGDEQFAVELPELPLDIAPDEMLELAITFNPDEEVQYDGSLVITSNDPIEPEVTFLMRGYGAVSEDLFHHLATDNDHLIQVESALIFRGEEDLEGGPLVPLDEVAVFTPEGLCGGHVVVEGDVDIGLAAYAADPTNPFKDGFNGGEPFEFRFWDWRTECELICEAEYVGGPETFTVNAVTTVILTAVNPIIPAQIHSDPASYAFGPLFLDESASTIFTISNIGGIDLTVEGVEVDLEVFEHNFGNPLVLAPDESFELEVTFTPDRVAVFVGHITVFNDDPDETEFVIIANGMGSDRVGHYQVKTTASSHTILIEGFDLAGAGPAIGDEVAAFTSYIGFCAGATTVEDPEEDIGLTAWGDVGETGDIVEGFAGNEPIIIHFWDASKEQEYVLDQEEFGIKVVEFLEGNFNWRSLGFTRVTLRIEDWWGPKQITPVEVDEDAVVEFTIAVVNPPVEVMLLNWADEEEWNAELLGEATFDANTGEFSWHTSYFAAGVHHLTFETYDDPDDPQFSDYTVALITVNNVNRAPEVAKPLENDEFTVDEDADWTEVALLDTLFEDSDGDTLDFLYSAAANISQRIEVVEDNHIYSVRPDTNWFGDVDCQLTADDGQGEDRDARQVRRVRSIHERTMQVRVVRRVDGRIDSPLPGRDIATEYDFTLHVLSVNDPPVIVDPNDLEMPDEIDVAVDEFAELRIVFRSRDDEDEPGDLVWDVADQDDLPGDPGDQWGFEEVDPPGTAVFTWTPNDTCWRGDEPYTPIFRVTDTDEETDEIQVNILVGNVNRAPELVDGQQPPNQVILEDAEDVLILDLDGFVFDPDGEPLAFDIRIRPEELGLFDVNAEHELRATPQADFAVVPPGLLVEIRATDIWDEFVDVRFSVSVHQVNDPPDPFSLIAPEDGLQIAYDPDSMGTIDFAWQEATQNEWEVDAVHYLIYFMAPDISEDSVASYPIDVTEVPDVAFHPIIADSLGIERLEDIWVTWWVVAIDDSMAITPSSERWRFLIPALGVRDQYGTTIPDVFFLAPNFPNPFNARTTVRFGLPQPSAVSITVWDMHGRRVAALANGQYSAGRYEAIWEADRVTSGVYLIRMDAGRYRGLQKAILLR